MLQKKLLVGLAIAVLSCTGFAQDSPIKFPADYKTTYTNYLNLDRTQNDDQIIRLYANDIAVKGMKENGQFPYGSVLIGEVYKAKKDANGKVITSALGRRIIDELAVIAVMEKQPGWGAKFPDGLKNGDWDFATFKPDGSVAKKDLNSCRACHSPLTSTQHTFSSEHLK